MRTPAFAIALVLTACKTAPTDDVPMGSLTQQQIEKEQSRVLSGEVVGDPLRAPKIVVGPTEVTFNGHHAAARGDLVGSAASGPISSPIHDYAKDLRVITRRSTPMVMSSTPRPM